MTVKPELDDQLAALVANGWSSSQIGLELGLTRNAVIGRCRRRGFRLLNPSCCPVCQGRAAIKPRVRQSVALW